MKAQRAFVTTGLKLARERRYQSAGVLVDPCAHVADCWERWSVSDRLACQFTQRQSSSLGAAAAGLHAATAARTDDRFEINTRNTYTEAHP